MRSISVAGQVDELGEIAWKLAEPFQAGSIYPVYPVNPVTRFCSSSHPLDNVRALATASR